MKDEKISKSSSLNDIVNETIKIRKWFAQLKHDRQLSLRENFEGSWLNEQQPSSSIETVKTN